MKVKRNQLFLSNQLFSAIWKIIMDEDKVRAEKKEKKTVDDFKTRYFLTRNIRLLENDMVDINKAGMTDFDKRKIDLIREYAVKGEDGQPIIAENGTVTLTNVEELNKKIQELQTEYKSMFDYLEEEVEFIPFKTEINNIKLNLDLGPQDMALLSDFILE